ncbi:hypothetical protein POZ03_01240 [Bacteroides uniformis]|nr:hypothetical protein [Bacteroides uniformis]
MNAIKSYLSVFHLMELNFDGVELATPTHILWKNDEKCSYSGRVIGIRYDGEHLFLLVNDNETNLLVTIPESTFASCFDTLTGIYSNLKESIHARSEEIRSRNPIKSQKASRYLKKAPGFCESGGYSENTLIQTVVLAEYELAEKANANITKLVDEIIELQKQAHNYRCPTPSFGLERCRDHNCDICRQHYYDGIKAKLLKYYMV